MKDDDLQESFDAFTIVIEKLLVDDFKAFDINWNGYGYLVNPSGKGEIIC